MASETTLLIDGNASLKKTGRPPPLYAYAVAALATVNSVNLGFDIGVSSGVGLLIQEDMHLSNWELGLFMGSIQAMAAVGSMLSHYFCDRLGRCRTFTVSQVMFLAGMCMLVTSKGFTQVLISRIFTGFAIGVAMAIDPLYISEVAPASHRGLLTTLSEIAINFGILLGFTANGVFADLPVGVNWRMMPICGSFGPSAMIILSLTVMPESPRWLVAQGRVKEAEGVLRDTHHASEDTNILLNDIKHEVEEQAKFAKLGWKPLLQPDAQTRWMMIVGFGVAVAQQITGIDSVVVYSPRIFKQAGVVKSDADLFAATVCLGIIKTLCTAVSACFLDKFGRRPLLLLSMAGIATCQTTMSIGFATGRKLVVVIGMLGFIAFFSFGIGPICWLLTSEVFPTNIRAKAMSMATTLNRLTSATVALTFLPLSDFLGMSGCYGLFAILSALAGMIQFFTVPETKGKTLESVKGSFDTRTFN